MPRYDAVDDTDLTASGLAKAGRLLLEMVRCMSYFVWVIFLATIVGFVVVILVGWLVGAVRNLLGLDRD